MLLPVGTRLTSRIMRAPCFIRCSRNASTESTRNVEHGKWIGGARLKSKDIGILFLLAALWGASFLFMRVASPVFGPIVLIDLRVLMAGIALITYAAALRQRPKLLHKWREYLLLGALNAAIPFCLIATAEIRLDASLAAILNATTPLFTALVARIWTQDRLTVKKLLGLLLGVLGVAVLVGWNLHHAGADLLVSVCLSLGAALFYGVGGVYSAKGFRGTTSMARRATNNREEKYACGDFSGEKPLHLAIGQQLAAGLLLLPIAVFFVPNRAPSAAAILSVSGLAILSTSLGYLLYFHLIRRVGPVRTLSVTFLIPVFGIPWGWLLLREPISSNLVLGLAIILLGVALVSNVPLRVRRGNTL